MPARKLILVLVDGLSADYLRDHADRLPALSRLAREGMFLPRVATAFPGTSMPGRASILTGVDDAEHGIYGNHLWKDGAFQAATHVDIRVPTLTSSARARGLDIASIGFGLVDPADATIYRAPWWMHGFVNAKRYAKSPVDPGALDLIDHKDPEGRLPRTIVDHLPRLADPVIARGPDDPLRRVLQGLACDAAMVDLSIALACSAQPPDLILTEINSTDAIQHVMGYASDEAHWVIGYADMLIGELVERLAAAGHAGDYAIAVTSDHGHTNIERAIYPQSFLNGWMWEAEGATLHVRCDGAGDIAIAAMTEDLGRVGVAARPTNGASPARDDGLLSFTAPPGHAFEFRPPDADDSVKTGPPRITSTHGLRPGDPADDRFLILWNGLDIDKADVPAIDGATASNLARLPASTIGRSLHQALGL